MSSCEKTLDDTECQMAWLNSASERTQGYAWQLFQLRIGSGLDDTEKQHMEAMARQDLSVHGKVTVHMEEACLWILVRHTAFPAQLHRQTAVWLSCARLLEHVTASLRQSAELWMGEEGEDLHALPETAFLPVYDWITEHTPICRGEKRQLRASMEKALVKHRYRSLGHIMSRDLCKNGLAVSRCFGYVPILLETLWYCAPSLSTDELLRGLDMTDMTRRPREALRQWIRSLPGTLDAEKGFRSVPPVDRVKSAVEKDCSLPYTLEKIGQSLGMSPTYFSRMFHAQTGQTFSEYLTGVRMNAACALMAEGTLTLSEIAEKCGYPSRSYFTQVFRNARGMTPEEYMNTFLQRAADMGQ